MSVHKHITQSENDPFQSPIQIKAIGHDHAAEVQRIYEASPGYFLKTARSAVLPHFAAHDLADMPPAEKRSPTYHKMFGLILVKQEPIGVVDLHANHPKAGICYIGLLLLTEAHQGQGMGRLAYQEVEKLIQSELSCSIIRLGVSADNNVEGFWLKLGFNRNGHTYIFTSEGHPNQVFELEKSIS